MQKTKKIPNKKFGGKHTTTIPVAKTIANILAKSELVKKISTGIIKSYRGKSGGRKHIKILGNESSILIKVTDNSNNQQVRIYTNDSESVKALIIKKSEERGFTTS